MTERDSDHWLWRLSTTGWLDAARTELEQGQARTQARRAAVTHARRAAGMALNGVLVLMASRGWTRARCESGWGRSYIDHLRALAAALDREDANASAGEVDAACEPFDREQAERCRQLLAIPVMPPTGLVRLSRSQDEAAQEALRLGRDIVRACAALQDP